MAKIKEKTEGTEQNGCVLDADGYRLKSDGSRDTRYKNPVGTKPEGIKGEPPGVTRMARMAELISHKPYELVREGFDANDVKSITGLRLRRYYVLKGCDGEEIMVGRGEMIKYAGIIPVSKRKAKERVVVDNSTAFVDNDPTVSSEAELEVVEMPEAAEELSGVDIDDLSDLLD